MSTSTRTVTKTTRTVGPDGKVKTVTTTEEIEVKDGKTHKTITTTQEDGGADSTISSSKLEEKPSSVFSGFKKLNFGDSGDKTETAKKSSPKSLSEYRKESLAAHNKYRAKHGVPALKMDDKLNATAQDWADHMAKTGKFGHRPNSGLGENIHYSYNQGNHGDGAVDNWYSEIKKYNFKGQGFSGGTGHFTQVVWKSSERLGIGMAEGRPGEIYVVGNYDPAGNMMGDYEKNVFPPK